MTKKFEILAKYIKDVSSETPDIETFLFVKENISKYQLNIDITSKALKNKLIEVNTTLKFEDKEPNEKKSYFEIIHSSIVRVSEDVKEKKELEKNEANVKVSYYKKVIKPSDDELLAHENYLKFNLKKNFFN